MEIQTRERTACQDQQHRPQKQYKGLRNASKMLKRQEKAVNRIAKSGKEKLRRDSSNGHHSRPRKRQRPDEKTAAALEKSVRKSEESVVKLQEHTNNGTCPKTL